ncbi:MAG: hypothetical protein KBF93_25230 [Leptospiraceae bacterium]|nr:hypothetical protein [Leptospiraceae bacterium]
MIITMKYFLLFLFFSLFTLFGQDTATNGETVETPIVKPSELNTSKEKENSKPNSIDDDELDKEFYTYYYMNLPKYLQKEDKDKKKLHSNLIRTFKKEIVKRDRSVTQEELLNISPATSKIRRVFEDSKWMKKIKNELRYIQFTEYMYIIKYKKYLTLILFHLDPEMHLQSPSQVEFLQVKEPDITPELDY